jgi:hypothetical protein
VSSCLLSDFGSLGQALEVEFPRDQEGLLTHACEISTADWAQAAPVRRFAEEVLDLFPGSLRQGVSSAPQSHSDSRMLRLAATCFRGDVRFDLVLQQDAE